MAESKTNDLGSFFIPYFIPFLCVIDAFFMPYLIIALKQYHL